MTSQYETPDRLASKDQQDDLSAILGLESEQLTNVNPLPEPKRYGAGRVKKFTTSNAPVVSPAPASSTAAAASQQQTAPKTPRGYPTLAKFYASDSSFFILRRFDAVAARTLLVQQDELCELETRLREVDDADTAAGAQGLWNLHSRREDQNQERKKIIQELKEKLEKYQKAVLRHSRMMQLDRAPDDVVESLTNWLDGIKPTSEEESHFANDKNDLVALSERARGTEKLDRFIEKHFSNWFALPTGANTRRIDDPSVQYYSSKSAQMLARAIVSVTAIFFLAAPIGTLYFVQSTGLKFFLILLFATGLAAIISIWTNSRNYEVFAVMAAYASFLVVFLGSMHGGS